MAARKKATRKKVTRRKQTYPKTIGPCIDMLYEKREARLALGRQLEEMKAEESALSIHILDSFKKEEVDGARGKLASASIKPTTVATVEDWAKFYAYIKRKGAWDLLQRRVNDGAYRERLEENERIPGVTPFRRISLSLHKVKR